MEGVAKPLGISRRSCPWQAQKRFNCSTWVLSSAFRCRAGASIRPQNP